MTYRLIALDIDGTLLNRQGQLTARVQKAVQEAIFRGYLVCLVSGRRPRKMQPLARQLGITAPLVAFNGGAIVDASTLQPLQVLTIPRGHADPILSAWEESGIAAFAYRNTTLPPDIYYSLQPSWAPGLSYIAEEGGNAQQVTSLSGDANWEPLRLMVMDKEQTAVQARALSAPHLDEAHLRAYFSRHYDSSWYFEVYPLTSKADGIQFLCDYYAIHPEQVVAVGDNVNDLDMLSIAGLGVAMGNATPQVQCHCDLVIGDHNEDGLAIFLEELTAETTS